MSDSNGLNKRFDELEKKLDGLALVNPLSTFNSPFSKSDKVDLRELWQERLKVIARQLGALINAKRNKLERGAMSRGQ